MDQDVGNQITRGDGDVRNQITRDDIIDAIAALNRGEPNSFGPSTPL